MTEQEWKNEFARRLRRIAYRNKKYNQRELAEASGINEVTVSRYYNGLRSPSSDNLIKLAKALDCTIDELIMVDEIIE